LPARHDGRPQYYDVEPNSAVQCYYCLLNGVHAQYKRGEAMINDPENSPTNDGSIYTLCIHHLPENAVIHDPVNNETRTKDGQNIWTEADSPIA
jgi:hypothetical protein